MNSRQIDAAQDIEAIALDVLKGSKSFRKLPTAVDRIVEHAQLKIDLGSSLHLAKAEFFKQQFDGLKSISAKILGMLDVRRKKIYLDLTQKPSRQNFIKLHEVGHDVLPWQNEMYCMDDEKTLDPAVKALFEQEASFFASAVLFQIDHFDEKASKLPLEIKSPMALAQAFGASNQAAIRRYVERSSKRCAVLVLDVSDFQASVRNYFRSVPFLSEFGDIAIPERFDAHYPFILDLHLRRRFHQDGQCALSTVSGQYQTFNYHFFNNSYNAFVFLFPSGESIKSRTSIIITNTSLHDTN